MAEITDAQREQWRDMGRASRRRQGLPDRVEDVTVLDAVATIYLQDRTVERRRADRGAA